MAGDRNRRWRARGVRDQVGEAALERGRLHRHHRQAVERHGRGVAVALGVAAQLLQRQRHVGRLRLLAAVAAREGEIGLQHAGHLVDVLAHAVDFGAVADQRQLELEAGQDGAQIVRHAGQHRGALLDRALDARFISMKACAARRTSRAPRGRKFGASRPLPKLSAASASRRIGLIWLRRNRTATISRIERGADHPEQEDLRIRGVGRAALREHAHHASSSWMRISTRLERPTVSIQNGRRSAAELHRQRLVEQREERLRPGGGMSPTGRKSTTRPSRCLRDARSCARSLSCG
jgi:hypothetical protein